MNGTGQRMLHSIADSAEIIGVKRSTIYLLDKAGEIETVKIGRRRLVTATSLEAYVERLKTQQAAGE